MKKQNDLPQWDLEAIYASPEAWEKDFSKLQGLAEEFAAYRGRLAESAAVLAEAMEKDDTFSRLAEKVYVYAHLRADKGWYPGLNILEPKGTRNSIRELS